MAKPIRTTPELRGDCADSFIKNMMKVEKSKLTSKEENLIKEINHNSKYFTVC